MPTLIACSCGKKLKVRDELIGKKVKCPGCGGVVLVEAPADEAEDAPARPKPPPLPAGKASPPPALAADSDDGNAPAPQAAFWECKCGISSGLFVVTDDALRFVKVADKELKRAKKGLEAGEAPEELFDKEVTVHILFEGLLQIQFNKKTAQLDAVTQVKEEKDTTTFHFDDQVTRDEGFKELRRRVGAGWEYQRRDLSPLQASVAPLLWIGGLVGVFGFLVYLAWAMEQPGGGGRVRTSIWGWLLIHTIGWLGPLWTGVIGGVCVVAAVAWMVLRIADPPIEITLKPKAAESAAGGGDEEEVERERPRVKKGRGKRREDD